MRKEEKLFDGATYLEDDVLGIHEIYVEDGIQVNFVIDLDEVAEILAGLPKMNDICTAKMFEKILDV